MTTAGGGALLAQPTGPGRERRGLRHRPIAALVAGAVLLALVVIAAIGRWIRPEDPSRVDFSRVWAPPSARHWFGCDQLGRDVLSRVLSGTGSSLVGPILLMVLATVIGVAVGLLAAWSGGVVDTVLERVTDAMFALPGLLFVVLLVAAFGKGQTTAVIGLGIAFAPVIAKFTRSIARDELARPYVDAYRTQGLSGWVTCVHYVLPNLLPILLGYLVVLFADAVMALATMSFLGFGAQPPSSSWGLMVQENQGGVLQGHLTPTLAPAFAIAIAVLAVNIVGVQVADRLRAAGGRASS